VAEPSGYRLLELVAVLDRLRSTGGCPWDARQTHESLVEYLIEETYETVEAIESGDRVDLCEELGDLLLQVIFHARIAAEGAVGFTIDDVADGITTKLISRHPHVFADGDARTADDVEANWHRIKVEEKGRTSVTDGIPLGLPALLLAAKLHGRATSGGVDVSATSLKVSQAALDAWELALTQSGSLPVDRSAALGEVLLALAVAARSEGIDPEAALRAATRKHVERIHAAEES
jgi:XTP/dITP diphosphohydrolase